MTQHGRHVFEFGPFRIEDGERLLRRGGTVVPLPPKAVALLMALLHRSGEFIEKGQLLAEVWPDTFVEEGSLTQTVSGTPEGARGGAGHSLHRDDPAARLSIRRAGHGCARWAGRFPVTGRSAPGEPFWRSSAGVLR